MIESIPHHEVTFNTHSFRDRDGRVFQWKGHLYRGITSTNASLFTRLFQDGTIQQLIDRGLLVETTRTDYVLDGFGLVVHHRTIPFVSYPTEWCAAMLRDAALVVLDLVKALAASGMTLKDAHPWNILFDGHKPLYIDLTSIIPWGEEDMWIGYNEFCREFLHPLLLMSHGRDQYARWFMNTDRGVWRRDLLRLAPGTTPAVLVDFARSQCTTVMSRWRSYTRSGTPKSLFALLKRLRAKIERVTLPVKTGCATGRNKNNDLLPGSACTAAMEQEAFHKVITELHPHSLLCIDSEPSFYPKLAARLGSNVVTFDTRPQSITQLYFDARKEDLPILPLMMDFRKPTSACGLFSHHLVAATERFPCDMVAAPRLMQHLHHEDRRLSCDQLVNGLTLFSKRWVLLRFIPPDGNTASSVKFRDWSSYDTLENFIKTVQKGFRVVNVIRFEPKMGALLICEK